MNMNRNRNRNSLILSISLLLSVLCYVSLSNTGDNASEELQKEMVARKSYFQHSKILEVDRLAENLPDKLNFYEVDLSQTITKDDAFKMAAKYIDIANCKYIIKEDIDEFSVNTKNSHFRISKNGLKIQFCKDSPTERKDNEQSIESITKIATKKLKSLGLYNESMRINHVWYFSSDNDIEITFTRTLDGVKKCIGPHFVQMHFTKYGEFIFLYRVLAELKLIKQVKLVTPLDAFDRIKKGTDIILQIPQIGKGMKLGNVRKCSVNYATYLIDDISRFVFPQYTFYIENLDKKSSQKYFVVSGMAVSLNDFENVLATISKK